MLRSREVSYKDEVLPLAVQIAPEIAADDDLFDEVSRFNGILIDIPADNFDKYSTEEKWMLIFQSNDTLQMLYKLVSNILSIPVSNAFPEGVFSMMNVQWTDDRNSLKLETVKALLQVKVNFNGITCSEMYDLILKNSGLLKQIRSNEKYFD